MAKKKDVTELVEKNVIFTVCILSMIFEISLIFLVNENKAELVAIPIADSINSIIDIVIELKQ